MDPKIIGEKIRERRTKLGWTVRKVATLAERSPSFISRLERGQTSFGQETIIRVAGAVGLSLEALYRTKRGNIEQAAPDFRTIPVLDYVQAGQWRTVDDRMKDSWISDRIPINLDNPPSLFAMRIAGDSMLPQFKPGDIVVIDPTRTPRPGSFVVATDAAGDATFKMYKDLGVGENGNTVFELVPLNTLYAPIRSDRMPIAIVGVMVEHRQYYH